MLDATTEHAALLEELKQRIDLGYQAGSQMVMKTTLTVYGVRTPDLRKIVRSWVQTHRHTPWPEVLSLVESLTCAPSQEERALAIVLLQSNPGRIPELEWDHFDRWRKLLDNWALTDGLGTIAFGPWIKADAASRVARLSFLIREPDVWSRRLALVATVPLNRDRRTALPDLSLALVDQVKHEREPMVTKAVSWVLRELTKTHRDRVFDYVEKNRRLLAPLAIRETENKLRTGLKSGKPRAQKEPQ
ncbi:MAG: DNA alkylation repair protein [Acidobacteria bacterium]|nr:MAG: DNA alkylation repair protein [Acidobacteriota bacterium]